MKLSLTDIRLCLTPILFIGWTASAQIVITNFTESSTGACNLAWTHVATNYIVEQRDSLVSDDWQYVDPVVATNFTAVNKSPGPLFYRIQEVRALDFPDPNFEQAILASIPVKHPPTNQIYDIDVASIDTLSLGYPADGYSITNTTGITQLPNLTHLSCQYNNIMNLDLTGSTNLYELYCQENNLTNLTADGCANLYTLFCFDNTLSALSLNNCTSLYKLDCHNNSLTNLIVTDCVNLNILFCSYNDLTGLLDLSTCTNLVDVDVTANPSLTDIRVWNTNNPPNITTDHYVNIIQ